ncbi:MAG: hypothetical protein ND866_04725 [Pyrinomonadaceae bacterium]|nr:hypothetical protein [Pyrinomonadaceae bacterium]
MLEAVTDLFNSITLQSALLSLLFFVITFAASLAIVSLVLVKLPATYFKRSYDRTFLAHHPPLIRGLAIIGKNLLGVALVVVGILLSLPGVPGQGMLTILLGIMLLDFPGKPRFEYWLVSRPKILQAINKLRHRFSKPALVLD